jgi:hypothetical protein
MIGLKNSYSEQYDEEVGKYTVTPPTYDDDTETQNFEEVFGQVE